jgi:hypothetical protein
LGYEIEQKLSTEQVGVDIIAISPTGKQCFIEAKGATSSKPNSSKFGKEFDKSQVKTHVGVALIAAFRVLNKYPDSESMIALPDNLNHRALLDEMRHALEKTSVKILFVSESGQVSSFI